MELGIASVEYPNVWSSSESLKCQYEILFSMLEGKLTSYQARVSYPPVPGIPPPSQNSPMEFLVS